MAMKKFEVSIRIQAPAETVWAILTDASQYTAWNSTVEKVEGQIAPGKMVTVRPKLNPSRPFPAKVTAFDPPKLMVWTGGMPLGLFKGERTFTLTERGGGVLEFRMSEVFSGLLSPLIEKSIPDLQPAFDAFAADLRKRAESVKKGI